MESFFQDSSGCIYAATLLQTTHFAFIKCVRILQVLEIDPKLREMYPTAGPYGASIHMIGTHCLRPSFRVLKLSRS